MTTLKKANGFVELTQGTETTKGAEFMYKRLRSQEVAAVETVEVAPVVEEAVQIEIPRFNVPQHTNNVTYVDFGTQEVEEQEDTGMCRAYKFALGSLVCGLACSAALMVLLYLVACIGANVTASDLKAILGVGMTPFKISLAPATVVLVAKLLKWVQQ